MHRLPRPFARIEASAKRKQLMAGDDPLAVRDAERIAKREALRAKAARGRTFAMLADEYLEAHGSGWSDGWRKDWSRKLKLYALDHIGNLLIPLLPGRIGPKRFKAVIDGLMRSGNAFFIEKNGHVLLMAENIKENAGQLGRFKRAERARTGAKQIKRGQEIPIAVLVRRVDLKRRLNLAGGVQRALPALARAIQQELDKS